MNDTVERETAARPPTPPRKLTRGPGGMVGGVCEGLGRYFDVDPVLFRIAFVVAVVLGGSGLLAYLVMWVVIPDINDGRAIVATPGPGEPSRPFARTAGIVVLVFAVLSLLSWLAGGFVATTAMFRGPWPFFLIVAGGALLWWGQREDRAPLLPPRDGTSSDAAADGTVDPHRASGPAAEGGFDASGAAAIEGDRHATTARPLIAPETMAEVNARLRGGVESAGAAVRSTVGTYQERPRRPRSVLGRVTVGITMLAVAGMAAAQNLGWVDLGPRHYFASALTITGLGLLVGSVAGRSRPLILLGLLLVPMTLASTVVGSDLLASAGDRFYVVGPGQDVEPRYELGLGQFTLDLSQADVDRIPTPLYLRMNVGELTVILPPDPTVQVRWRVDLGEVALFDAGEEGRRLSGSMEDPGTSDQTIVIDVEIGVGQLNVIRSV